MYHTPRLKHGWQNITIAHCNDPLLKHESYHPLNFKVWRISKIYHYCLYFIMSFTMSDGIRIIKIINTSQLKMFIIYENRFADLKWNSGNNQNWTWLYSFWFCVWEVSILQKQSKSGELFIPEKVSSLFSRDNRYGRGNYYTNHVSHSRQSHQH